MRGGMAMAQRAPIFEQHTATCAELRMLLAGTPHEALAVAVYTQAEEMQLALWRAINELRLGEITPRTDRATRMARHDLAEKVA